MANNGGRQAGGGGNGQMNEHVEFTVKAEEDLYLSGSENTIRRVTAETNYSCLMLKTQRFSSLFRHYAKYHGLRKDDLEYYFVNPLENEDTPESVQLQRGDTIMVRKRRKPEPPEAAADDEEFFKDMRELLEDEEHMDCIFLVHADYQTNIKLAGNSGGMSNFHQSQPHHHHHTIKSSASGSDIKVKREVSHDHDIEMTNAASKNSINSNDDEGEDTSVIKSTQASSFGGGGNDKKLSSLNGKNNDDNKITVRAHKCILTARAEYFKALFRKNSSFRESDECIIRVEPQFGPCHIRYLIEFIYTNRIQSIKELSTDDLLCLLHLSDRWLLRDLKRLVEHELIRNHMTIQTVARMYGATEDFKAQRLSRACIDFIMENLRQLAGNAAFEEEMKNYPHLCIPVLKAAADLIPEGPVHKKQRTESHTHHSSTNGAGGNNSAAAAAATPSSTVAAAAATAGGGQGVPGAGGPGGPGGANALGSSPVPDSDP